MAAETVMIEVQKDIAPRNLGRAHVTTDFTMHNLGTARVVWKPQTSFHVLTLDAFHMFSAKKLSPILLIGLFLLGACASTDGLSSTPAIATASQRPTPTKINALPTPSATGDSVIWRDLQISMTQAEITDSFINEFGSQRLPSAGRKFLWIHVILENKGKDEITLPEFENFSVLYAESEFKPIYGHRQGYADYTLLDSTLFPKDKLDAWLRFDIPDTADLKDLRFVFLPESAQVGASPSSPNYPYPENKPTYVWKFDS